MSRVFLKIDGNDFTPFIKAGGYQISRNDQEGSGAGRTLAGSYRRDRVGVKHKIDISCKPLTEGQTKILLRAIYPEYIQVEYWCPRREALIVAKCYSDNVPTTHMSTNLDNGQIQWAGIDFQIVEV